MKSVPKPPAMENPGVKNAAIPRIRADIIIFISNENIPLFFIHIPPHTYISGIWHIQTIWSMASWYQKQKEPSPMLFEYMHACQYHRKSSKINVAISVFICYYITKD